METKLFELILKFVKLPFYLLFYFIVMILTFIIPVQHLSKVINIVDLEEDILFIFSKNLYIKVTALILTVILFTLFNITNGGLLK